MGDPFIENATPFAFQPLFLGDEDGRSVLVPLVKGTYRIGERELALAPEQDPASLAGEPWGDPAASSYRYEPEGSLPKPATDVVLVGSAIAPARGTRELMVAFSAGPLRKAVRVTGDRVFFKALGSIQMTSPLPFERIPLRWESAFGGWDRSDRDEARHQCEHRNPVGVGFRRKGAAFEEGVRCPNVEDPGRLMTGWSDRPPPAGFGFTSASWEPRRQLGGTYDAKWAAERAPLLPLDFTRRFLSAAPPGLVAPGYLRGDEQVAVGGVTADGKVLVFRLPGGPPPEVTVVREGLKDRVVRTQLDTVTVDTDAGKVFMLWKGELALRREPLEVRALAVAGGPVVAPGARTV